jgi:colicin import membrane protein
MKPYFLCLIFVLSPLQAWGQALEGEPNNIEWIGFQQLSDSSRVFVRTTEEVRYQVLEGDELLVSVILSNASITLKNNHRPLHTAFFEGPVRKIEAKIIEGASPSVRLEITLKARIPFETVQSDNVLSFFFDRL